MSLTIPLFSADGNARVGWVTAEDRWVCGFDFCDNCGDCMACYGGERSCSDGGIHRRILYEDGLDAFLDEHEGIEIHRREPR